MRILDREQLGLRKFWKEYRNAIKVSEAVHIITHKDDVTTLQKDLKLLLSKTIKMQGIGAGAVVGLTHNEIKLILEVLQWVIIMALIGTVIYLASKKYKFKIHRNKNGEITIEGEPK